jgi:hypothetical protein
MTVKTSRKKKKAKLVHSPSESEKSDELILKQLFQCRGFTVESIHQNKKIKDVDAVIQGFHHVVGVSMRYKADAVSNQLNWSHESNVCGVIRENEQDQYLVKEPHPMIFAIHSVMCMGTGDGGNTCLGCLSVSSSLYRHCKNAVSLRQNDFHENTTNKALLTSPSLVKKRFSYDKSTRKKMQNRLFRLEAQRQHKKGVRLPSNMKHLFDNETEQF